jgi:hypothetical protein
MGFAAAKGRLIKYVGSEDWTLHDLRRTCTTGVARLGVAPHVAERVINHKTGTISGVAAVYNRFEYMPERKAALDAWAVHIQGLIRPSRLRRPGSTDDQMPLAAE